MPSLIAKLAENSKYLLSSEIEGIMHILVEKPGITSNELIRLTGIPKETLREFKSSASFLLKPALDDSIHIREEYITELGVENLKPHDWQLFNLTNDAAVKKLKEIRNTLKLSANRDLDQFFATEETSLAKALLLQKMGVLDNSEIALLGDDDLVAVAASLLDTTFTKITVFDIDRGLLTVIKIINEGLSNKGVHYVQYDSRDELGNQYQNKFDVVVTDPPYTKTGIKLFLNRAVQLLKNIHSGERGKLIFLYFGTSPKTPEKTLKIQEIATQMGLIIEDRVDNFAHYYGAESIGSSSSLYVLKTTPFTKALSLTGDYSELYTSQQQKEEKFPFVDQVVAKIYDVPKPICASKTAILKSLGEFCKTHKLKVVDEKVTKFSNGGLTITFVLANSNLVLHVWPEYYALHLDLVTCSPIYNKNRLIETLAKVFGTRQIDLSFVE